MCFLLFSSIAYALSLKDIIPLDVIYNFFNQILKIFEVTTTATNRLFYVVYHDVLVDSSGKPNTNAYRIANVHPVYVHTYARVSGGMVNTPQEVRDLMHNNGVKILCYVKSAPPDSTSPPFSDAQVRSEIADGMNLGCDGIMLDNVRKQFSTYFNTYKGWRDYIKTWGSDKIAWFNTGHADMDESIMQVADIVEVEHHIDDLVVDSPWVTNYPSTRFAANVISWEDIGYYPLGYKVTLETAIRDTNHCWDAGHIAYMYSGNIQNFIGWLPTWFENYVSSILSQTPTTTTTVLFTTTTSTTPTTTTTTTTHLTTTTTTPTTTTTTTFITSSTTTRPSSTTTFISSTTTRPTTSTTTTTISGLTTTTTTIMSTTTSTSSTTTTTSATSSTSSTTTTSIKTTTTKKITTRTTTTTLLTTTSIVRITTIKGHTSCGTDGSCVSQEKKCSNSYEPCPENDLDCGDDEMCCCPKTVTSRLNYMITIGSILVLLFMTLIYFTLKISPR